MSLARVGLSDKYEVEQGRIFLTGTQALVRLPMMQRRRDLAAGLNTGCFISGYRGSPLGSYDRELWRAQKELERHHIHFRPGVNEDLAATSVWGSQQVNLHPKAKYDGVFAIWYGKGPGLDRCGDVMRHANAAGVSKHGGVLAVVGDDHAQKSSSQPAHAEPFFADLLMPVLYPADIQEMLDYGLLGFALSRFTGGWVGFKVLADAMDSSAVVEVGPERPPIVHPTGLIEPAGGPHIRWPEPWDAGEVRSYAWRLPAAIAFARANGINRVALASPRPRLGIVTTGKSYLDVLQALRDLGLDEKACADAGITILKLGMPWPGDHDLLRRFGDGLEEVVVVEEKRRLLEADLRDALYALPDGRRPRVIGRTDEAGVELFPPIKEHDPDRVARVLGGRLQRFLQSQTLADRLAFLARQQAALAAPGPTLKRTAYFCSGCPHSGSTKVPEGSRAIAGVGCHFMAVMADRSTSTYPAMGGEGAQWIGQAPFTDEPHVFANVGEGTYYHSAYLALRACVAANVDITIKVLFNDAVAMTGGQPVDGPLTVPQITRQARAEGVERIAVVADDPDKYPIGADFAPGVTVHHRDELDAVQQELRATRGVTVLVYDQVCAAEKRRRRKRGEFPDPDKRVFVNELVCEGCGDCSKTSNCVSVAPVETEWGRKRAIDQSSCNKDYSCAEGFCPSFVVVRGGRPRRRVAKGADVPRLPEPTLPALAAGAPWGGFITGIGGTGVVTISALMGMAAHLEGKAAALVDVLGMAQKGGAVVSHVRIAAAREDIASPKLNAGAADLLLGCDLLGTAERATLNAIRPGATRAVVNLNETITGAFAVNPDLDFPRQLAMQRVLDVAGAERTEFVDANRIATALFGDSIAVNLFLFGFAWQRGLIPLSLEAIERAIELNEVAVVQNKAIFAHGRWCATDRDAVERLVAPSVAADHRRLSESFEEVVSRRRAFLADYQDAAYAGRYERAVRGVEQAERERAKGMAGLADAVARNLFRLMAYKDEYEVARLYGDPGFKAQLVEQFEGDLKLEVLLAPPLFARRDPHTGRPRKRAYGGWIWPAFRQLAKLKRLRGTRFDPFGRTSERRAERALIAEYEATVAELSAGLDHDNHALAVQLAKLPEQIRGYGHVKDRNLSAAAGRRSELLALWRTPGARRGAAAE